VKILITGGTGMVGQNLQVAFRQNNLEGVFVGRDGGKYDLTDWNKTQQLFADVKPDVVIHAGANVGGIGYNKENPGALTRDNLKMGIHVLDACVEHKVESLYITSTCCSYPKYCRVPFSEDEIWNGYPESTNAGYGIAKKTIMKMGQDYRKQYGLKNTCFILANLYGFHDNFNLKSSHVIPALIRKFVVAKEKGDLQVSCWGTGMATRSFLFAEDLATALTKAVQERFDHPTPINLGTKEEISIYKLAYLIRDLTGYSGDVIFDGSVSDGQPRRLLDTSRAKSLLNWEAKTSLKEGLIKTIEWYRANKHIIG
jgi:nucleoside-diphosphate-sugar epimerase